MFYRLSKWTSHFKTKMFKVSYMALFLAVPGIFVHNNNATFLSDTGAALLDALCTFIFWKYTF